MKINGALAHLGRVSVEHTRTLRLHFSRLIALFIYLFFFLFDFAAALCGEMERNFFPLLCANCEVISSLFNGDKERVRNFRRHLTSPPSRSSCRSATERPTG